jgi:hypothetical protein
MLVTVNYGGLITIGKLIKGKLIGGFLSSSTWLGERLSVTAKIIFALYLHKLPPSIVNVPVDELALHLTVIHLSLSLPNNSLRGLLCQVILRLLVFVN